MLAVAAAASHIHNALRYVDLCDLAFSNFLVVCGILLVYVYWFLFKAWRSNFKYSWDKPFWWAQSALLNFYPPKSCSVFRIPIQVLEL